MWPSAPIPTASLKRSTFLTAWFSPGSQLQHQRIFDGPTKIEVHRSCITTETQDPEKCCKTSQYQSLAQTSCFTSLHHDKLLFFHSKEPCFKQAMIFSSYFPCHNLSLELCGGSSSLLPGRQEDHCLLHWKTLQVNATIESSRKQEVLRVQSSEIHTRRRGGGRLQISTRFSDTKRALTSKRAGSDCGFMYIIIQPCISLICFPVV